MTALATAPTSIRRGKRGRARRVPHLGRELSWIEFNARVLHEAADTRNPLLERVKFLAIFASNLDEFFQVRISALRRAARSPRISQLGDGPSAAAQLAEVRERIVELIARAVDDSQEDAAGARTFGHRGHRLREGGPAPRCAARAVHGRDLPGPHAAGGRPGPPVPVHLVADPLGRRPAQRPGDRRAPVRPGQGPGRAAAARRAAASGRPAGHRASVRAPRPAHQGQSRQPVHRPRGRREPPLPRDPGRGPRARGGGRRQPPRWRSRRSSGGDGSAIRSAWRSSGRCRPRRARSCAAALASTRTRRTRSAGCST